MWMQRNLGDIAQYLAAADSFVRDFLDWASQHHGQQEAQIRIAAATDRRKVVRLNPTVREYLVKFALCSDLPDIINAYHETTTRYMEYVDGLHPVYQPSQTTHELLKQAFDYFYDKVLDQVTFRREYVTGYAVNSHQDKLRKQIRRAYIGCWAVCPYCDSVRINDPDESTFDHFLPRSTFPWLSVHWQNLVVCCGTCNTPRKLATKLAFDGTTYHHVPIFHPYFHQPADAFRFIFNILCTRTAIEPKPAVVGTRDETRLKHYAEVFKLQTVYEAQLDKLRKERRRLRQRVRNRYWEIESHAAATIRDVIRIFDDELSSAINDKDKPGIDELSKFKEDFLIFIQNNADIERAYLAFHLGHSAWVRSHHGAAFPWDLYDDPA